MQVPRLKRDEELSESLLDQKFDDGIPKNQYILVLMGHIVSSRVKVKNRRMEHKISALREQRVIELALEHWHNITCLNFERRDDEPKGNRIVFTDVDGCASNVGKHPLGEPQFVSLAPECIRVSFDFLHPFTSAFFFPCKFVNSLGLRRDCFVYSKTNSSSKMFLKSKPNKNMF